MSRTRDFKSIKWGVGSGEWADGGAGGDEGDEGEQLITDAQCLMPNFRYLKNRTL
ncbi:hypothetical protein GXM_03450 [Nostoc sphaeroides CCNUC1]|uniref:Uncharacterized protein n=1 Tax=Nostoc sphaeroides CCNUC1 TaxID=2653204 RepID=A0A5P8W030_9NOSO|nr:hypothetical protein GXM_03450 [Nostoc sphaeroides CCNUC1]